MINKENIAAFDLDGTILDSAQDLIDCLNIVLKEKNQNIVNKKSVSSLVGNGALAMIKEAYKINQRLINDSEAEILKKRFLCIYKDLCVKKSKLFPYTIKTLQNLKEKNFILLMVSNKPEFYVKKILKYFNIYNYFAAVSGGDTFSFRKPDPRHLIETIKLANIKNYNCWFVGDSQNDALCAKKCKAKLILLQHGYSKENLYDYKADFVLKNLKEVSNIMLSNN